MEFPSPYGDFVFQRWMETDFYESFTSSFRPLTGILFFNAVALDALLKASDYVSVPLRGFCFST